MSSLLPKSWSIQFRELVSSPFAIIALTCVLGYVAYMKTRRQHGTYDDEDYENEGHRKLPAPLTGLHLTRKQLAKYNSKRPDKTYLVALFTVIYDVSSAPHDFGPGGKYAKLSGTEVTGFIKKQSIVESRDYESYLSEWKIMLEDFFYPAGKLIDGEKLSEANELILNKKKMDAIPEEKEKEEKEEESFQEQETEPEPKPEQEQETEPNRETETETYPEAELLIPEFSKLDLSPPDEGINSDCDSLRTAYDFPPGQDDRLEDVNDDNDEEEFCEAGQGDNDGDVCEYVAPTDEDSNQSNWNDGDVTMVPNL
uniref:Uncharacterized protein LOC108037936 n=1 Tax=Drosophila rhopaloa TaxID=1041015 RepID=A0A6P4E130_DRORH